MIAVDDRRSKRDSFSVRVPRTREKALSQSAELLERKSLSLAANQPRSLRSKLQESRSRFEMRASWRQSGECIKDRQCERCALFISVSHPLSSSHSAPGVSQVSASPSIRAITVRASGRPFVIISLEVSRSFEARIISGASARA